MRFVIVKDFKRMHACNLKRTIFLSRCSRNDVKRCAVLQLIFWDGGVFLWHHCLIYF